MEDAVVKQPEKNSNKITESNWIQYILNYEDLILAGLNSFESAKQHWESNGQIEGRIIPLETDVVFDWKSYIENNRDLLKVGINTYKKALDHWMTIGLKEGRKIHYTPDEDLFDWEYYLANNEDIKLESSNLKEEAMKHWNNHGKKEKRKHRYNIGENQCFDWVQYRENYPDLKKALHTYDEALMHWHNHGQREGRTFRKIENDEKYDFDWKEYLNSNQDLKNLPELNSLDKAYDHWLHKGKSEGREFKSLNNIKDSTKESILTSINNLFFKPKYHNYGLHYCGWEKVINHFIKNYKSFTFTGKLYEKVFFDEWLEKLLIWGNETINQKFINQIKNDNLKLISFIHNPNLIFDESNPIPNGLLINDEKQFNKNLFSLLKFFNLESNIEYLYCLSICHKASLITAYPEFKTKFISVHHPIQTDNEGSFNYNSFLISKKIIHIGWWLRDFNTFINLQVPPSFKKKLIIKNDFKKKFFEKIVIPSNNNSIEIKFELSNNEYVDLFTNSVIFADIIDGVANNTILECIAFNTPIILRRTESSEEYLGPNYPLFFDSNEELNLLYEEPVLLNLIDKAYKYMENLDKTKINFDSFNEKLNYDLMKLNKSSEVKLLTWNVFANPDKIIYLSSFIDDFLSQDNVENLTLNLYYSDQSKNNAFKTELKQQQQNTSKNKSIKWIPKNSPLSISDIKSNSDTEYFCILDISDTLESKFSITHLNYFKSTPACDISTSSYYIINKNNDLLINKLQKDDIFIEDIDNSLSMDNIFVFRSYIFNLSFLPIDENKTFSIEQLQSFVYLNINIHCCSAESLHTLNLNT